MSACGSTWRLGLALTSLAVLGTNCGGIGPPDNTLSVVLSVSNPNPQVGDMLIETVALTCDILGVDPATTIVSFDGPRDRLEIDELSGTASLILDASDAGNAFAFTCTAVASDGQTATSNEVVIIPTT